MIRTAAMAILLATSFVTHASEEASAKADPAKGKAIAETVCVACHGADGNSQVSANPILAGQVEEYIYKQLKNFKPAGDKPAVRNNPIMAGMAAALSDEDMKNVAAWFSSQKQKPAAAKDERQIALGQKIWRQGDFKKGLPRRRARQRSGKDDAHDRWQAFRCRNQGCCRIRRWSSLIRISLKQGSLGCLFTFRPWHTKLTRID